MPETVHRPLSAGDRLAIRVAEPAGEAGRCGIVVLASDGCVNGPDADRVVAAWSGWATVAVLELPLCGARASDKLTIAAFAEADPLAARLEGDLAAQLASDLGVALQTLVERHAVAPERCALVALGRGARLAQTLPDAGARFAAVVIGLGDRLDEPWLERTASELRAKLAS